MKYLAEVMADLASNKPEHKAELVAQFIQTNAEGEEQLLDEKEIANKLKEAFGRKFKFIADEKYKRGIREKGESFEKYIREKYDIADDAQGEALVDALVATQLAQQQSGEPADISDDKIQKHPLFQRLLKEGQRNAVQTIEQKKDAEIAELKKTIEARQRKEERDVKTKLIRQTLLSTLKDKKVYLGEDEEERSRKIDFFLNHRSLDPDRFIIQGEGEGAMLIPVDDKGEPLEDNFKQISASDIVMRINPFKPSVADPSKGSPSPQSQNNGQRSAGYTGKTYADVERETQNLPLADRVAKRKEFLTWQKQNGSN